MQQAAHTTSDLLRLLAAEGAPFADVAAAVAARFGGDPASRAWLARTLVTLLRDGLLYTEAEKLNAAYLLRFAAPDAPGAREALLHLSLPDSGEPAAQRLIEALRGSLAAALTEAMAEAVDGGAASSSGGARDALQPQHMRGLVEHNSSVAAELLLALTARLPAAAAVYAAAVAEAPMSAQSVECISTVIGRGELPDWVLTTFLSNCMQDTNACQDAGRQSRQVKLLCACVGLALQHQPASLAEALPELQSFCIQLRGGPQRMGVGSSRSSQHRRSATMQRRSSRRGAQEPAGPEDHEDVQRNERGSIGASSEGEGRPEAEAEEAEEGSTASEEEEEDSDEEYELEEGDLESDGEEDVYALLNRAASMASSRQIQQFPLLRDWTPPVMRHELAAELSMRSAAASLRGAPHPLARQAMPDSNGSSGSSGSGRGASGSGAAAAAPAGSPPSSPPGRSGARASARRSSAADASAGAAPEAPPTPPATASARPKRLNPAHALLLREARQGSRGGHMLPEQCAHFAAFHRLPREPTRVFDQRPSRAYIGQFTLAGDVFIAAFQHERRIRMYDVHRGFKLVKDVEARGLQWTVTDTALSGDNRFLLYSSITPEVHLVNMQSTDSVHSVANVTDIHETLDFAGGRSQRLGIWSIEWTPDSRRNRGGHQRPGPARMRTVAQVGGHGDDVNAVAYAEPDAPNVIFSGSDDSFVKVWDRRTMGASGRRTRPAGVFVGHTEGVTHLDSKGDGRYVISNSKDQSIKLWDTRKMAAENDAARLAKDAPSFHWDYRWMEYPARGRVVQHPGCQAVQTYRGHAVLSTLI
ncbi:hypothetical protein COHA_001817, partial [Chlorella ohadii]